MCVCHPVVVFKPLEGQREYSGGIQRLVNHQRRPVCGESGEPAVCSEGRRVRGVGMCRRQVQGLKGESDVKESGGSEGRGRGEFQQGLL